MFGGLLAALLAPACAADPTSNAPATAPAATASTSQSVLGVPGPDPYPFERVGVYVSQAVTTGYAFSDLVNGPAGLVSQLGTRVIRIFLSNPDKYTGAQYGSLAGEAVSREAARGKVVVVHLGAPQEACLAEMATGAAWTMPASVPVVRLAGRAEFPPRPRRARARRPVRSPRRATTRRRPVQRSA